MSMADQPFHEHHESLWNLIVPPAIWSAHFLLTYITAAVWCAKSEQASGDLTPIRTAILVYTLVALAGIALAGWRGYQRHSFAGVNSPHDFDSAAGRHAFLGFAVVLLATLSAIATIYVALPALFIGSCR